MYLYHHMPNLNSFSTRQFLFTSNNFILQTLLKQVRTVKSEESYTENTLNSNRIITLFITAQHMKRSAKLYFEIQNTFLSASVPFIEDKQRILCALYIKHNLNCYFYSIGLFS